MSINQKWNAQIDMEIEAFHSVPIERFMVGEGGGPLMWIN
jgi:hypothetical protein